MDEEYYTNVPWNVINCSSKAQQNSYTDNNNNNNHYCSPSQPTSSLLSNDAFTLRELIGKIGGGAGDICGATSFNPPLSPPKLPFPVLDHVSNMGSLGNSLPPLACDPGFAERAAKFSCLGSRSFNGRATQRFGLSNAELSNRSNDLVKLQRVSSSPVLKRVGSSSEMKNITRLQIENRTGNGILLNSENELSRNLPASVASSNEGSLTNDEIDSNTKKRKAVLRVVVKSCKENSAKIGDADVTAKRSKQTENRLGPTNDVKTGSDVGSERQKQKSDDKKKPSEPPKDYIHVRARKGEATDSHSLAERVRREKISERMKLLQDLVPGCNKVTGKALMLDEIINYVQSLQRQVEFLSMKLASVNPGMDVFQENGTLPQELYPIVDDTSSPAFYHHHQINVQQPLQSNANLSVDPMGMQFPSPNGFSEFTAFGEDDLRSIVHMGFLQNPVDFPVPDQTTQVKIEL